MCPINESNDEGACASATKATLILDLRSRLLLLLGHHIWSSSMLPFHKLSRPERLPQSKKMIPSHTASKALERAPPLTMRRLLPIDTLSSTRGYVSSETLLLSPLLTSLTSSQSGADVQLALERRLTLLMVHLRLTDHFLQTKECPPTPCPLRRVLRTLRDLPPPRSPPPPTRPPLLEPKLKEPSDGVPTLFTPLPRPPNSPPPRPPPLPPSPPKDSVPHGLTDPAAESAPSPDVSSWRITKRGFCAATAMVSPSFEATTPHVEGGAAASQFSSSCSQAAEGQRSPYHLIFSSQSSSAALFPPPVRRRKDLPRRPVLHLQRRAFTPPPCSPLQIHLQSPATPPPPNALSKDGVPPVPFPTPYKTSPSASKAAATAKQRGATCSQPSVSSKAPRLCTKQLCTKRQ